MKRFEVEVFVCARRKVEVEAETKEGAEELAEELMWNYVLDGNDLDWDFDTTEMIMPGQEDFD